MFSNYRNLLQGNVWHVCVLAALISWERVCALSVLPSMDQWRWHFYFLFTLLLKNILKFPGWLSWRKKTCMLVSGPIICRWLQEGIQRMFGKWEVAGKAELLWTLEGWFRMQGGPLFQRQGNASLNKWRCHNHILVVSPKLDPEVLFFQRLCQWGLSFFPVFPCMCRKMKCICRQRSGSSPLSAIPCRCRRSRWPPWWWPCWGQPSVITDYYLFTSYWPQS